MKTYASIQALRDIAARIGMLRFPKRPSSLADRLALLRRELRPYTARSHKKIRVGGPGDGGYVMLDDFDRVTTALSIGIGPDVSWDLEIARRGIVVHQFDDSAERPPVDHSLFRFRKATIGKTVTLAEVIAGASPSGEFLLKIDIEHDEWDALSDLPIAMLDRCSQVVCEFHWFNRASADDWFDRAMAVLAKLNRSFRVVHVHANNWADVIEGMPDVIEVTYASRRLYRFAPSAETFPTALDAPNNPLRSDHVLGRFGA